MLRCSGNTTNRDCSRLFASTPNYPKPTPRSLRLGFGADASADEALDNVLVATNDVLLVQRGASRLGLTWLDWRTIVGFGMPVRRCNSPTVATLQRLTSVSSRSALRTDWTGAKENTRRIRLSEHEPLF